MEDILAKLSKGEAKPYEVEKLVWDGKEGTWEAAAQKAAEIRLAFLERQTGKKFPGIAAARVNTASSRGFTTGIEQKIGGAVVPLGAAGPVKIDGQYANGEFWVPAATNEAALVAGLNRGIKLINKSGGIKTVVNRDWMTRAPAVEAPDVEKAAKLCEEIGSKGDLYKEMKKAAESESRVSKLLDIQPFQLGRVVYLRFLFQTGDSMGMNSATKYSANAIKALTGKHKWVRLLTLTGNMCMDKKAGHINVLLGRGKSVEAEVVIKRELIEKTYNTTPEDMARVSYVKNYQGACLAGTNTGYNLNAANTIAALFIATGQDAAQIVESSSCFTRAEVHGKDLLFSVTLPCLEVATVGGGTGFGTAKECLEILGCSGPGKNPGDNSRKLAEIIAAAVAAQELNLLGAQANRYELAESHIKMARGK
jgi:hydroxymethylglutaryl-CoA reductase (NADPH)